MNTERGCVDVDECAEASKSKSAAADSICRDNEFCVNLEGSHSCHRCHVACSSCTGDGPDECTVCAEGYTLSGHVCIDAGRAFKMTNVRYLTYFGLFVAICIIFQRSALVSGLLGLVVVAYISLSEYYLQGATGELRPITMS